MTFGSLFAGIGGMDLGLERAGMECRWQVEIDPFCRKVLEKHWPNVPKYGDIRELTGSELERVDVVAGGFPCQDVSMAGLRRGVGDGTRSGLYAEMVRLIGVLRPPFVLVENVAGLLIPNGPDEPAAIARVLGDLAEIGHDAEWDCFPASAFGAPHQRDRVFIVAYACGNGLEAYALKAGLRIPPAYAWSDGHTASGTCASLFPEPPGARQMVPGPSLLGMDHGVPYRVDRIKGCGNAVVPQVAEWIGRRIMEATHDAA